LITLAEKADTKELNEIISKEFPYKKLSKENIAQRIKNPSTIILKKTFRKRIAGFIDVEVKETTGFINAISVKETYRRKGFGKELINYALEVLKQNNILEAKLLVKKENLMAKKFYTSIGFTFQIMHNKKIEESIIEVWRKELFEETNYLN